MGLWSSLSLTLLMEFPHAGLVAGEAALCRQSNSNKTHTQDLSKTESNSYFLET